MSSSDGAARALSKTRRARSLSGLGGDASTSQKSSEDIGSCLRNTRLRYDRAYENDAGSSDNDLYGYGAYGRRLQRCSSCCVWKRDLCAALREVSWGYGAGRWAGAYDAETLAKGFYDGAVQI
jgi:hypothetical protein